MSKEYKKFGELTRDDQLELINHVLDGGDVEINSESHSSEGWCKTEMPKLGCLCFYNSHLYRKVKTELEILKEDYEKIGKKIEELEGRGTDIEVGDTVLRKSDGESFTVRDGGFITLPFLVGNTHYTSTCLKEDFTLSHKNNK